MLSFSTNYCTEAVLFFDALNLESQNRMATMVTLFNIGLGFRLNNIVKQRTRPKVMPDHTYYEKFFGQ